MANMFETESTSLYHFGILGQKWGVRRFQNEDGSLTSKGRKRYRKDIDKVKKKSERKYYKSIDKVQKKYGVDATDGLNDYVDNKVKADKRKTALKIGAAVVGTALVAYGGYKLTTSPKAHAIANNVLQGSKKKRLAKLDKTIENLGPQIVKKSISPETSKLASDASALARSVIAEGPKSFSKPVQNAAKIKSQMTSQKFEAVKKTYDYGKTVTKNLNKAMGQQTFIQAAKANDELISELLKKNAKVLSGF